MHKQLSIHIFILVLLLLSAGQGFSRTINVSSASAINKTWSAGDTLLFTNGNYSNLNLTLKGTGTASKPIVLKAVTIGSVVLGGSSTITLDGGYIEVHGLRFTGSYTGKNHIIQFSSSSSNCRVTECKIDSYNTTDVTKDYKWVSIRGIENRVDHCYFSDKTNMGTLLVVWLEENIIPRHRIDHNHFFRRVPNLDENGKELNAQEIIRIGDSSTSMQTAACTVEDNLFEECDGEIEIISNKSCGNIYRHNTFRSCSGMLTLRHGNNCIVEKNLFFGNEKNGSGGVRIIGEGHVVRSNYFESLAGNNYRAGICIVRGKKNSELNEYFQVKDATITHNIFVNCKEAFCVNYNSSSECTMHPLNTKIENNLVYNNSDNTGNRIVTIAETGGSLTWSENSYNAGKWKNYSPSSSEWKQDKNMTQPDPNDEELATIETRPPISSRAQKIIRDGQMLIQINECLYSSTGQLLKRK